LRDTRSASVRLSLLPSFPAKLDGRGIGHDGRAGRGERRRFRLRSGQDSDGLAMFIKRNHTFEVWDEGSYGVDGGLEGFSFFPRSEKVDRHNPSVLKPRAVGQIYSICYTRGPNVYN
jgi:hypothetical protein